jgi:hypothetical protein
LKSVIAKLRSLADLISAADASEDKRAIKRMREDLEEVTLRLSAATAKLDPILRPDSIFDPTDPSTAGRVVALTLMAQQRHPLSDIPEFYGAGVYAIYYKGDYEHYSPLSGTDHPIYVGKADPSGPSAKDAISQGVKLSARLSEHAKSIRKARSTLKIEDFDCRFLIVQSGFQKSAEDYLINAFRPIWNSETRICFGLGKHGDSSLTRVNKRSPWDTMHPGRAWADSTSADQKPAAQIIEQLKGHFSEHKPFHDVHDIFTKFMYDMRQLNTDHFHSADNVSITLEVTSDSLF